MPVAAEEIGIATAIAELIVETADNGGSTVSPTGQPLPTTGYMVGGATDSLIMHAHMLTNPNHHAGAAGMIGKWAASNIESVLDTEVFLGGWIDTETDMAYVDLTIWYSDREQAIRDAKLFDEIAIWDVANKEEIRVS
jgi:hypothetical protein